MNRSTKISTLTSVIKLFTRNKPIQSLDIFRPFSFITGRVDPSKNSSKNTVVILLDDGGPKGVDEALTHKSLELEHLLSPIPCKSLVQSITQHPAYKKRFIDSFFGGSTSCTDKLQNIDHAYAKNREYQRHYLQTNLNRLIPEMGPFHCYNINASQPDSFENLLNAARNEESHRVIFLILSCLWSRKGQKCISALFDRLGIGQNFGTVSACLELRKPGKLNNLSNSVNKYMQNKTWTLVDSHPFHPALADVYAREIRKEIHQFPYDIQHDVSLLFCAPEQIRNTHVRSLYEKEISAACLRIIENLRPLMPAYSLAFYKPWTSYSPFWGFGDEFRSLNQAAKYLCKVARRPNVLLVPLDCISGPSIDTEILLSSALKSTNFGLRHVQYLRHMPPLLYNNVLSQGLAEIVKSHILTVSDHN